ncbi:hypothetical protein BWI17_18180 [Betaproteobacteria bacterium GR16-43]|nr:hypothetical protein BWI17_18180 [Betaproteobacteria bacterium GR16-43]
MNASAFHHIDPTAFARDAGPAAHEIAELFLEVGPQQWESVEDAWRRGSHATLARRLHVLRGSCAIIGARAALNLAGTIERDGPCKTLGTLAPVFEALRAEFEGVVCEMERFAGHSR